tara:strand:- start:2253 stop:2465 length:213 start_codon:yes stop_codon:yes gene_type:complete
MSLFEVLLSIRRAAKLTKSAHNKLARENPLYLEGWLAYEDAIFWECDRLLTAFERDGISYHDPIFTEEQK